MNCYKFFKEKSKIETRKVSKYKYLLTSNLHVNYLALLERPPLCDLCGLCGGKRLGRCSSTRKGRLNSRESSYIGMLEGNKKSPPPRFPPLPPPLWWKTARTLFPNEKGGSEILLCNSLYQFNLF
jgi:hypothetical protein